MPLIGGVGQAYGDEVGFKETQDNGAREADVGPPSCLQGATVGAAGGAGGAGAEAVRSKDAAAEAKPICRPGSQTWQ